MSLTPAQLMARLHRALEHQGNLYSMEDIMDGLATGHLQSWATANTWVITRVCKFPQKTTLDIMLVVGEMSDVPELEERIVSFAKLHKIALITASGRAGWARKTLPGWQLRNMEFYKEIA